ncbi:unnamed protein product [Notodromas monacha]|uniref:MYND-type domain-containing protein n=1 Tax=Notodromas monacha TaxID=399045 RepID=A0A7R9BKZ7_9CRUS|nr:unnamed protein product [Notodromas monacha]CAG0917128.1 unnamed protein product [Notodromas monacha]
MDSSSGPRRVDETKEAELGFVNAGVPGWKLASKFFPSKLGGKPAWLALQDLPSDEDLRCRRCQERMAFLLQIYAPIETRVDGFHRTLFVFLCRTASCGLQNAECSNMAVFRSQLPRENPYYSFHPTPEKDDSPGPSVADFHAICWVCGQPAYGKRCSKCKTATYCSALHQKTDWKAGHRKACGEYSESELLAMAKPEEDPVCERFLRRVRMYPEQVLRYHMKSEPLWVSVENQISLSAVPPCALCGAPRHFEFQIMPQLLTHLSLGSEKDAVDWGTIAVYTCSDSCRPSEYAREFLWKQDFSPN